MNHEELKLNFWETADCRFTESEAGFLLLEKAGEKMGRVKLRRCYPYTEPSEYIAVCDLEDNELGILRDLALLDPQSQESTEKELAARYFCPALTEIKSVKEKMGHFYFEVMIGSTKKNFTVRNITNNVRLTGDDTVLIFDMDGNRFVIPQFSKIPSKSRKLLEPYLY